MAYELGIDLGTTFSAAAVWAEGRATMVDLQYGSAVVPSVVALTGEGDFLVGEPAERRAVTQPDVVAREFKRRVGDPVPYLLGSTTYSVEQLVAELLRWIAGQVTARQGGEPPDRITITHPANWRSYKRDVLAAAVARAGLEPVDLLPEPVAAALHHRLTARLEPGSLSVVYDLGGGTFDAALVRSTAAGTELVGEPEGIEHLGGLDFDDALFRLVDRAVDGELGQLDSSDPVRWAEARRVRAECTAAKVALSSDTSASIPVLLDGRSREVRVTRDEFEALISPLVEQTLGATARVLWAAGVEPDEVSAFLLVGGSSRVPLVAQRLARHFGRPVSLEAHPKHAVALGAARHAHDQAVLAAAPPPPVPLVSGPRPPDVPADAPEAASEPTRELVIGPLAAAGTGAAAGTAEVGAAATGSPGVDTPERATPGAGAMEVGAADVSADADDTVVGAERPGSTAAGAATLAAAAAGEGPSATGGGSTAAPFVGLGRGEAGRGDGGAGDGAPEVAVALDGPPKGRGLNRARLVGAGALGGLALLAVILLFALLPAGGEDTPEELSTVESTTSTTLAVEVLAASVTEADAAVADGQTSTSELQAAEQAASGVGTTLNTMSGIAAASVEAAGQKSRGDLQAQAQALVGRADTYKAQAGQLVSETGGLKARVAAAVTAAAATKAQLDEAREAGDGDAEELGRSANAAKLATAALLVEVRDLAKRVNDLTTQVAALTQEINALKGGLDGIPLPTAPPATPPPQTAPPQTAPPATAPPPTAPPPTAPPPTLPALTVSISGPGCVPVGATSYFTGYSATGVSGQWSLPAFTFDDPSWSPGAPTQYVRPAQEGDFQWTLFVQDAYGQSASASFAFSARNSC